MEKKKLTKELLDKVRHIEGFPKGKDEDIIELSDPPYYTACPNPFIQEFVDEYGTPYDEDTDEYHREPFASDVSEGKNDLIYNAHSYHTKVPPRAIMRYILHYSEPSDIVFDGFCGTGMTGVAAQMCEGPSAGLKMKIEKDLGKVKWGKRVAILGDLSPAASFITYIYNSPKDVKKFEEEAYRILKEVEEEYSWMYKTQHRKEREIQKDFSGNPIMGTINYIVWSDVFACPECAAEIVFWNVAAEQGKIKKEFFCPSCQVGLKKKDLERVWISKYDREIKKSIKQAKQHPVKINYSVGKKRYEKKPDSFDFELINKIENMEINFNFPIKRLPDGYNTKQPQKSHGITYIHQFYTRRNFILMSALREKAKSDIVHFWLNSIEHGLSKRVKHGEWSFPMSILSGTLYIPSQSRENNPLYFYKNKLVKQLKLFWKMDFRWNLTYTGSTERIGIGKNTIDYIFTDPPFGSNIMYSELNFLWEAWLKVFTNNESEAIVNKAQNKGLYDYQLIMEKCFSEMYRILKPGRWLTMVFHNSKNSVWNAIQEALLKAGFIVADVRLLDKQQGSFKQVTTTSAVKKDLIVSAYKPKERFIREFSRKGGSEEGAWEFISQHLEKLPVVVEKDYLLNVVAERQNHLLYDRMVAFHIQNGYSVPMGVAEFFEGLKKKFPERDGMYFLPEQAAEYDKKRLQVKGVGQLSLFISDEKSAIQWLRSKLEEETLTYQEIMPDFMREANFFRHEKGLELQELLEQNFLQDDKGRWYVPDPNKQADLEKLRERALLREFGEYKESKGKLKKFRAEAVRAGFKHCWSNGDYKTIIEIAKRIPDSVLQEDASLLMYYNNSLTREGQK